MGAGRSCVVSATHMSYRTPDNDPCERKESNTNRMASQVVVGCCRLGFRYVVVSLRGGGGGTMSHRMVPCIMYPKKFPLGVGGWTSGVQ
eukprot:7906870-Pyramimonas_sp.AAC.1